MATVFVSYPATNNGKAPANLIHATVGKETVPLVPVDIGNEKLNCIQAAEKAGVLIPRYCWHPALTVVASCRMCLVEVGERKPTGEVSVPPKVVPGCQTPVKDGTVIITTSARARGAQRRRSKTSCSTTRSIAPSVTRRANACSRTTASASAMRRAG